jgi:hypothetical protein
LDAEHRFSVLVELVHVELEFRLKAGEAARVENYLQRYPELDRPDIVIALLVTEYRQRQRREPQLTPQAYLVRFPHYAEELGQRLGATLVTNSASLRIVEKSVAAVSNAMLSQSMLAALPKTMQTRNIEISKQAGVPRERLRWLCPAMRYSASWVKVVWAPSTKPANSAGSCRHP